MMSPEQVEQWVRRHMRLDCQHLKNDPITSSIIELHCTLGLDTGGAEALKLNKCPCIGQPDAPVCFRYEALTEEQLGLTVVALTEKARTDGTMMSPKTILSETE